MEEGIKKERQFSFWEVNLPLMGKQVLSAKPLANFLTPRDAD
jgi:hypothetical protein